MLRRYRLSLVGLCLIFTAGHGAPQAGPAVVLENHFIKYTIGADSRNLGFVDLQNGQAERLVTPGRPFATLFRAGKAYPSTACAREGDKLVLSFQAAGATVTLKTRPAGAYFAFEVESLSDPAVEKLELFNLTLASCDSQSWMSGVAIGGQFAAALRVLDASTSIRIGGSPTALTAVCQKPYPIAGAKVALAACPAGQIRPVLKEVIHAEGLPESPLGGPWAQDAQEPRSSYVFAFGLGEANVEQWIALAKKAGIVQIHFCGWEQSLGHYTPNKAYFPHGITGLQGVVKKIHAAGLRAGMHTLTGAIAVNDPWASPVPDKRLARDARLTLAAALDAKTTAVSTLERPGDFDTIWAYGGKGNVLRIGDELIRYGALGQESAFGFKKCTRGAFGTKPAAHAKGAAVDHLFVRYATFQPDENSTLVDDVADAIAGAFNACGFDMIYMDGAEGMPGGEVAVGKMRAAIFRRLKGRVLVEASDWDYLSWPFHSRLGAWDYPNWGLKQFNDEHCRSNASLRRASLLPTQLGWWAILGPEADHPGEFPDEVEYLCAKALAWDEALSFQGLNPGRQPANARQDEYLAMIGNYERLRLANAFSAEARRRLRAEGEEFHLVQAGEGKWAFVPTDYAAHKVTGLGDGSDAWTVTNRFGAQPARLRLEALYGADAYDSTTSLVLAGFARPDEFKTAAAAPGIEQAFAVSREQVKAGAASGRFSARNGNGSPVGAWARATLTFAPEVNLAKHQALGVWIHGDGQGELLNFQLTNPPQYWPTFDEHYVKVDFKGWRYFELLLRERDAEQFGQYTWPYHDVSGIYRSALIKEHTSALNLYFNNLPPGRDATCYLGPIKALAVRKVALRDPVLEINGRRVEFPVTLESGSYLEVADGGACKVYNERGALLRELPLPQGMPVLAAGKNGVRFTCRKEGGERARAKVTLIGGGEPFQ